MRTIEAERTAALTTLATGTCATIARVGGETRLVRRLAALGVRPGALVTLGHRTAGGGRVVAVAGSRIALDRDVLAGIEVVDG